MKIARLEILGIDASLRRNESYYDDGFVSCLKTHAQKLCSHYPCKNNLLNQRFLERNYKETKGFYLPLASPHGWEYHIAYKNCNDEAINLFTRAHEETHVMHELDGLDTLTQRFLEDQRVLIDFKGIGEEEIIADLGAIYALIQRNLRPEAVRGEYKAKTKNYFDIAMKLYNQSKIPARCIFT